MTKARLCLKKKERIDSTAFKEIFQGPRRENKLWNEKQYKIKEFVPQIPRLLIKHGINGY